ncbi:LuxR C-terminal-related transcriptional regulator [Streptomyces sp. NPDC048270]|uniref:response regulator transcription factor n=1 Tax=Streptomyces sp. NPDC048270 TaxID=3154615 RepID=UPI0033C101A3
MRTTKDDPSSPVPTAPHPPRQLHPASPPSAAQACAHLRVVEDILDRLDNTVLLRSCRSLLAALSDPSPGNEHHFTRLTPREHEVGQLVGLGLTNREVAEALHLSEKTVEFHLRNLYAKLGVSNRRELRSLLTETPAHPPVHTRRAESGR